MLRGGGFIHNFDSYRILDSQLQDKTLTLHKPLILIFRGKERKQLRCSRNQLISRCIRLLCLSLMRPYLGILILISIKTPFKPNQRDIITLRKSKRRQLPSYGHPEINRPRHLTKPETEREPKKNHG
jgi:hypothetical protein